MKSFKQYIIEAAPGGEPIIPGKGDIPDGMSPAIRTAASMMSTAKGYIYGLNPDTMPVYQYRSMYSPFQTGLNPGEDTKDGYVSGGGGFKIQKDSRDYLINLAKMYGVDIETQESMQQKQQQQMQQQQGQQGKQQMQQPQQPGGPGGEQGIDHYLLNQVKMHPAMYLLNQDQNLQKEFDKAFKGMLDWKTAEKNPDEGKDWYTLLKDKQKKEEENHKMNLGRMATLMSFRERATEIYHRLNHHGLATEDLPHIKNYLDQSTHENGQEQQEPQQYDDEYGYGQSDADTNYDYGYDNQNTE